MTNAVPADLRDVQVEAILDWGAPGLAYFAGCYPLYQRYCGSDYGGYRDAAALAARYDEQRGLRSDQLADAAATVSAHFTAAQAWHHQHESCVVRLPHAWSGTPVADSVLAVLVQQLQLAGDDIDAGRAAADAMGAVAAAVAELVAAKATTTRALVAFAGNHPVVLVAGRPVADIAVMVETATAAQPLVHDWAGENAVTAARQWLDTVFAPEVRATIDVFVSLCDHVRDGIAELYEQLVRALNAVGATPYPRPDPLPAATPAPGLAPAARHDEDDKDFDNQRDDGTATSDDQLDDVDDDSDDQRDQDDCDHDDGDHNDDDTLDNDTLDDDDGESNDHDPGAQPPASPRQASSEPLPSGAELAEAGPV